MSGKTKLLGTSLLIIASSSLNAGFYMGAGLGADYANFTQRAHVYKADPNQPLEFDVINKAHLAGSGIFGTLFGGFGGVVKNQFYLAGEINGNLSSLGFTGHNYEYIHLSASETILKIKNTVGLSILPGYQFSPATLFYGRLGVANSKFQQDTSDISLMNFGKRRSGFRYGLGVKQAITDRLAVRMDYSRIAYNTFDTGTFDAVGNTTKNTQLTANQQLVEFGLIYNFA